MADLPALALIARYPQPGAVKTRLAAAIGVWGAFALYAAFLRDLDVRLGSGPWQLRWITTPEAAPFRIWLGTEHPTMPQRGSSLNERLRHGFEDLLASHRRAIIMSTDSPQVPREWIVRAFALLDVHDVVLGPCHDGGYYLVGLRARHDIFTGIPMGTPQVLRDTMDLIAQLGLSLALLPATFDVDDADGLAELVAWLRSDPSDGLPRTRSLAGRRHAGMAPLTLTPAGACFAASDADVAAEVAAWRRAIAPHLDAGPGRGGHAALVARIAASLAQSLRRDAGIPVSDLAVRAAAYHDAWPDRSRSPQHVRPWGPSYRDVPPIPLDHHEACLAWSMWRGGARRLARIVRRNHVLRALDPSPSLIDEDVLLLANAMADADRFVTIAERRDLVAARYARAHPALRRVFRDGYAEVQRRLDVYRAWGLDLAGVERAVRAG